MKQTSQERLAQLRLFRSENVGPITFRQLLARFGSAENALKYVPELAAKGGSKRPIKLYGEKEAIQELNAHEKQKITMLFQGDDLFPTMLSMLPDAPPILSVKGDPKLLSKQSLAIVGARNSTLMGRKIAATLAQDLGREGFVITSGLARGIDTHAHEASLDTGTVAVLAGGVDQIYPPENEALYHKIAEFGAIVSESPLGQEPQARLFPKRNRIISGLSLGVIVVEAALKSGSLITAQAALDQNREIFAVPGSPLDPRASGTNALLKQGANFIENAADVTSILRRMTSQQVREHTKKYEAPTQNFDVPEHDVEQARQILPQLLSYTPVDFDMILRHTHLSPQALYLALLELELAGMVERSIGNQVSLISDDLLKTA